MKSSCISHPPKSPLVILREEYLMICDGDHCEAAVLNQFEYWTNVKLGNQEQTETESKIASAGGVEISPSDLWIYKSQTELHEEMMGLFGIRAIGTALQSLVDRGFLERRNNPKYAWDRTYQYRLQTTKVQDAILHLCKIEKSGMQSQRQRGSDIEPNQNEVALPEITTEITSKGTTEKKVSAFLENPASPNPGSNSRKERTDDEKTEDSHPDGCDSWDSLLHADNSADDSARADICRDGRGDDVGIGKDPLMMPLERHTAAVRAEAGNYADPGDDAVADAGLVALHKAKGGSAPRKGTGTYIKETEAIAQALRDRSITDFRVAVLAAQMFVKEKPKLACPHYKSFVGDYGEYLGRAGERIDNRDARALPHSPPEGYEPVYGSDPEPEEGPDQTPWNLTLDTLRAQVGQITFFGYYHDTRLVSLEDGMAVVQARNSSRRDFLQNRAEAIGRELSQVLGRAVEVRFETKEES